MEPITLNIDGLNFCFPVGWQAGKYDEWKFYRDKFIKIRNVICAVDAVAVDPENNLWLIEVKDYHLRDSKLKESELIEAVLTKVIDTMACLLPASLNASSLDEKQLASAILNCKKINVVLHIEQPTNISRLRPVGINFPNVKDALKRRLKPVTSSIKITSMDAMNGVVWNVRPT